jgi:hypothetical protein
MAMVNVYIVLLLLFYEMCVVKWCTVSSERIIVSSSLLSIVDAMIDLPVQLQLKPGGLSIHPSVH